MKWFLNIHKNGGYREFWLCYVLEFIVWILCCPSQVWMKQTSKLFWLNGDSHISSLLLREISHESFFFNYVTTAFVYSNLKPFICCCGMAFKEVKYVGFYQSTPPSKPHSFPFTLHFPQRNVAAVRCRPLRNHFLPLHAPIALSTYPTRGQGNRGICLPQMPTDSSSSWGRWGSDAGRGGTRDPRLTPNQCCCLHTDERTGGCVGLGRQHCHTGFSAVIGADVHWLEDSQL